MSEKKGLKEKFEFLKWLDPFTYVDIALDNLHGIPAEKRDTKRKVFDGVVYVISGLFFAFIIYTLLGMLLATSTPMVIVVSGSMEPNLYKGDVIVLQGVSAEQIDAPEIDTGLKTLANVQLKHISTIEYEKQYIDAFKYAQKVKSITFIDKDNREIKIDVPQVGTADVVVYNSKLKGIPIIHRIVAKLKAEDGWYVITKGDNPNTNLKIDQDCQISQGRAVCNDVYPAKVSELQGKSVLRIPLIGYIKILLLGDGAQDTTT